ncbi:hydantoinase/oxoprolinase family protein [Pelotomaculum terephthalicicum JT]|uniref:hydantoinase/oxoprolinase family protein n=1 Tax=Pelotomaculum TaxID=191373 RepID=UPI0009C9DCB0|nr:MULTISPECIES: hydantoinase/oxoprolinase family protein [Pelotomaculum]MCG9966594.1 hydantoinase/oxoprolinase family protein [Pelotomaculum terephthalicicum JT]OPX89695.1 MAG: Acetophenone carboxylase gamma subunit [Pelotomaculum sp. PtaB.Bin117]OPY63534.1 MAG: Acetophenone carboxylase gamma subunit [Pelotomaculum sp. PtaU1.Bin065]
MFVGVDVGGTYTDAVLLDHEAVRATAKIPTRADLLESVLEALDIVLKDVDNKDLKRIVISTTVITNLIAGRKYDKVALLLIPGPGLSHRYYDFKTKTIILTGAIDYRGREIVPLDEKEIVAALSELAAEGYKKVGVAGKFSPRNSAHEKQVAAIIQEKYPDWQVELGFRAGPQLNFPRRAATTYLTCATREPYRNFVNSVRQALEKRKISAEVFILKADGGTMPLDKSVEQPVETIFSGPAASTLGVQALTPPDETEVVVDIGGTTTDIALILNGQPLLSAKGARVNEQLTQVHTLAVRSVPVGGDSLLELAGDEIVFRPERLGPAYCMGGPAPTPTDALRVLGLTALGEEAKAEVAMEKLGAPLGLSAAETAGRVIDLIADSITAEVEKMFLEWEQEPAYRIWELLQKRKVRPSIVAGVGGGADGLIPQIAAKLGCDPVIPPYAPVANAVGAAVARPTLQVSLRADTEQGYYQIREEGFQGKIDKRSFNEQKALALAREKLLERAADYGLAVTPDEIEVTYREVFNMIRGWDTSGRLYDFTVQTPRGITCRIEKGGK